METTNSTLPSSHEHPETPVHTLSWQSAFWALLALAITTASQDSGTVLGLPSSYRVLLRFSPAVCIVDSFDICLQLVRRSFTFGVVYAIGLIVAEREIPLRINTKLTVSTPIIFCFTLLSVTQAVKLFSCRGIPWTQGLAAVYLFAFVSQGVLNLIGSTSDRLPLGIAARMTQRASVRSMCFALIAVWMQFNLIVTAAYSLALRPKQNHANDAPQRPGGFFPNLLLDDMLSLAASIMLFLLSTVYTPLMLSPDAPEDPAFVRRIRPYLWSRLSIPLSELYALFLELCTITLFCLDFHEARWFKARGVFSLDSTWHIRLFSLKSSIDLVSVCTTTSILAGFYHRRLGLIGDGVSTSLCTMVFLTTLASGVYAYALVYDADNTYKPTWSDKLG